MKKTYIVTFITCLVMLAGFCIMFRILNPAAVRSTIKVGFIYDNDESTAYTYNFSLAKDALEKKYGDRVEIYTSSNVLDDEMEEPLRKMAVNGCDIIFFNGYSEMVKELAPDYPNTQFCQTSYMDMSGVEVPENYHTFKGEAYQGRYVSGIAAGMKIKQMISDGIIGEEDALVGFVAAFPTSEVISGYTAFILGVRSVVPQAVMKVAYTYTWSSYAHEKSAAQQLINDGCVIISQHTDTIGSAVACEMAAADRRVIHVGYNQDMVDIAPNTSLISCRVNWTPYVVGAAQAVLDRKPIEKAVEGSVHDSDICAGFDLGWVQVLDLNKQIAAFGTQEKLDKAVEALRRGTLEVYRGDYTGVDPINPSDTCDLKLGYQENEKYSWPTFHYILNDVITVE